MSATPTLLDFPRRPDANASRTDEQGNALDYHLSIPEDAMYGELKRLASLAQAPLSFAYPIAISLHAGRGVNMHDERPRHRPTAYTVLLGPAGNGKSNTFTRMMEVMGIDPRSVPVTTPGSERGLIKIFESTNELKSPLPATLVIDEMRAVLKKMAIQGSALEQAFCDLWSRDSYSVADKKGTDSMYVRLSLIGNVKIENQAEFTTVFGAESAGGFADRLIYAPPAPYWEFDLKWKAPPIDDGSVEIDGELFPATQIKTRRGRSTTMPDSRLDQVIDWQRKMKGLGVNPGRLTEIALRVAMITASANGDEEVTEEGMAAALAFAEWQLKVRAHYVPGSSENEEGRITTLIMNAIEDVTKSFAEGNRPRVEGKPLIDDKRWVKMYLLLRKHSWHKTYGSNKVSSALRSLCTLGLIEQLYDENDEPKNCYRLCK